MDPRSPTTVPLEAEPIPLSQLRPGQCARLHSAAQCEECELLCALGLTDRCRFRVCKAGDPWILQVRSTRIGLAASVAKTLLVFPEQPL